MDQQGSVPIELLSPLARKRRGHSKGPSLHAICFLMNRKQKIITPLNTQKAACVSLFYTNTLSYQVNQTP